MTQKTKSKLCGTYRSMKFLVKMSQSNATPLAQQKQITLHNKQVIDLDFYPAQRNSHTAPSIMFVHGINKGGKDEPRIINLCRSISSCGFNVIAPHYPDVAEYWIDPNTADNIAHTIDALCLDRQLTPTHNLGLFSISFTGTLSLHAASRCSNPQHIRNILLMGSFSRAKPTLLHILSGECTQDYPKLILLRNLMHLSGKADPEIIQALLHAINDNFVKDTEQSELHAYLNTLALEKQQSILDIVNNIHDSAHYIEQYHDEIDCFAKLFENSGDFNLLQCPVTIIHGKDDNTIRYEESLALNQQLNEQQIPNQVLITQLIENHSHYTISLETMKEFIRLATTLSSFFDTAQQKKTN